MNQHQRLHVAYTAAERSTRICHVAPQPNTDHVDETTQKAACAAREAQRRADNDAALQLLAEKRIHRDNALIASIDNWIALAVAPAFHEYARHGWDMFHAPFLRELQVELARHGYTMHPSDDDPPLICID